jgi:predicted RNA-binding protein with PIN domain
LITLLDGYNFIGRDKGLRGNIEEKRNRLLERMGRYAASTGEPVVVIYDGGKEDLSSLENLIEGLPKSGAQALFSGKEKTADDLIGEIAERLREKCVIVSSDRAVMERAARVGAEVLRGGAFESRLREVLKEGGPS